MEENNSFEERINTSKAGNIISLVETLPYALEPVEYFAKLSDYGRKKHSILLESADIVHKYGEKSLGSANPCLMARGKGEDFEIIALNNLGVKFIKFLKNDFDFCDNVSYKKDRIIGKLSPKRSLVSEEERLKLESHMDIIRKIAFKLKPAEKPFVPYAGLFGFISYDFIDQFEDLPKNSGDIIKDPDYLLYFLDNLFLIDHKQNTTYFIANALMTGDDKDLYKECISKINKYKESIKKEVPKKRKYKKSKRNIQTDTEKEAFLEKVKKIKEHIRAGDIYQGVISRTIFSNFNKEPLDIYKKLRKLNPSPYMFYINDSDGILLGASPEMSLKVEGDGRKTVEIRPIAGTKPRGFINGNIDLDLDSRYETELKIDIKEVSEHTMLVDLARNDVAKISDPGTRYADKPFIVEKYSHVQHLVSNVRGILKENLDALHAYMATMNMGTLTGAPKVEAMKLMRLYEKNRRGFYGGSVGYITPSNDLDSAITIRSIRIKNNKAYMRSGAGIVYDSDPDSEYMETERKAAACLKAIEDD